MRIWVYPPLSPVWELDTVVLLMTMAAIAHALSEPDKRERKENLILIVTSFLLGLFTEHASLRFGGTHCHASGLLNFFECSSVNSVCYYIGWVYTCIIVGRRLTIRSDGTTSWVFPYLTGGLFFGMCGVYECQGPLMGWWLWPREDGIVKPNCDIWQFGKPGENPNDFVTTDHVEEALGERIFGFPLLAPYFHSAFGWGIAMALQLTTSTSRKQNSSDAMAIMSSVLLGPALGMLWDPPIRILKALLGASKVAAAPAVMALVFVIPLITGDQLNTGVCRGNRDLLLVLIPMIQHIYFVGNCLFGHGMHIIPGNLKLFICCVALVSVLLHSKAIGYAKLVPLEIDANRKLDSPKIAGALRHRSAHNDRIRMLVSETKPRALSKGPASSSASRRKTASRESEGNN